MKEISQKIKINPNNKQKTYLLKCFGCKRLAYNWGVEQYNKSLEKGIFKSGYDLKKEFNSIKKSQFPFVYDVTKYATQQPFLHLNRSIKDNWKNRKKVKKSPYRSRKNRIMRVFILEVIKLKSLQNLIQINNI